MGKALSAKTTQTRPPFSEQQIPLELFERMRAENLARWPTGAEVDLEDAVAYHQKLPRHKQLAWVMRQAQAQERCLTQPRGGFGTLEMQLELMRTLDKEGLADVVPTTTDSYTRNRITSYNVCYTKLLRDIHEENGRRLQSEIIDAGGQALFLRMDATREDDWQQTVAAIVRQFGKLDTLVNSAGIYRRANLEQTTVEEWDRVMSINVRGVFLGTKTAIPAMRKAGGGSIINLVITSYSIHYTKLYDIV